jgi:serine/threonine-protein kinase
VPQPLGATYALERELGRGGMATVYLASDRKHGRRVAVKVLHAELAAVLGPERFLQEIRVLAALQHPHILGLIDSGVFGEEAGELRRRPFYVMPYVEGESLRRRLDREGPLPIVDAVRIADEVAGALDYAHRHGIVHRDVKPENILLHDGRALVADFGIALAVSNAGGQRMTQTGISLGTPQYMAPEQAMGERGVDARADVYALGVVTYEMLAGEPPFTGPSAQAIVAKVMTERPAEPMTRRGTIPLHVQDAVLTALEKLPADRFASAADFAAALAQRAPAPFSRRRAETGRSASRAPVIALGVIALAMAAVAAWALLRRAPAPGAAVAGAVYEATIVLPDSAPLAYVGSSPLGVGTPALAVSPDGATLVFVGQSGATTRLYVRPLDGSTIAALPGTEGAYAPFFSPDGQSVGFFTGGTVKRTSLRGGATVSLAELVLPYGGVWLADGRILVVAQEGRQLAAVPSAGGTPTRVGPEALPLRMVFPEPLPGDSTVLMSTIDTHLAVVSTRTGRAELLGPDGPVALDSVGSAELFAGTNPRFVSSGHLLYHSLDGAVMAVPFDPGSRRALGPPVPVLSGVRLESIWGVGQLAVTRDGALVYARGANGRLNALVWRNDRGQVDTLAAFGRADYGDMDLSPDGTRLVLRMCTSQGTCAPHALRLRDGVQVSLPVDDPASIWVSGTFGWADRGERVFDRRRHRGGDTSSVATVFYSPETPARSESAAGVSVLDVARDGVVLFERGDSLYVARSITELGSTTRVGFQLPEPDAWGHQLRQGGEWVAYTARSEQAGEYVVFLAHTRPPFEHWRASPRGGEEPVWSPAGELVYREGNRWMSVAPPSAPGGRPGAARFLFSGPYLNVLGRSHDIAPDGRHLLIAGPTELTTTSLTLVTNWVARLPARTPRR